MRTLLILAAFALGTSSLHAQEADPATQVPTESSPGATNPAPATTPADFARKASQSNIYEIRAAEIALERAQKPGVRELAQSILRDHKKAQHDLAEAAGSQKQGLDEALDAEQTKRLQALRDAPAGEFDAVYLSDQLRSHQEAMQLLSAYSENGEAGPFKTYAQAAFPTVRMHLVKVRAHSNPD